VFSAAHGAIAQGSETLEEVETAVESAFRAELKRKAEIEVLGFLGINREVFVERGREYFGEQKFGTLLDEVRGVDLETDFLLAGFSPDGWPHIFSVAHPGNSERHGNIRFHAIGTGSVMADAALCATYDPTLPLTGLIYRLCEAKFLGQSAYGVGSKTFVLVIAPDGTHQVLYPEHVEEIRAIWKASRPPVPSSAHDIVTRNLTPIPGWKGTK
jgi:hypothetical protein